VVYEDLARDERLELFVGFDRFPDLALAGLERGERRYPEDIAVEEGAQPGVLENDVERLVPGDVRKLQCHRACDVTGNYHIEAAYVGDYPQDISYVGVLEIEGDELSFVGFYGPRHGAEPEVECV